MLVWVRCGRVSAGHVGGPRGSGIVSSSANVLGVRVIRV